MEFAEILTILAVLLSPLIAVQVAEWVQRGREKRQRQTYVFRTLMATRASALAAEHVQALNMIDIEFHGTDRKSKAVLNAWKAYLDQLNVPQTESALWGAKRDDLFVDLLYEMALFLDYDFDKTHIRRTSYFPIGHGELESDQYAIRKGLLGLFNGQASIPISLDGVNRSSSSEDEDDDVVAEGSTVPPIPLPPA